MARALLSIPIASTSWGGGGVKLDIYETKTKRAHNTQGCRFGQKEDTKTTPLVSNTQGLKTTKLNTG